MDTQKRVDVLGSKLVFDGFFQIREATVRFQKFDGEMSRTIRRLVFERGDSVAALLLNTDTQCILLTNQFRYPTYEKAGGWVNEVIAGMIDDGEEPEESVRREILEEAGYRATTLTHIGSFFLSPGGSSERIILFFSSVTNADKVATGGGMSSEDIQMVEVALPDLWTMLANGEINDAKTLIAVQWLQSHLKAF